jgi:branched-chain amino acid transport system permease protein
MVAVSLFITFNFAYLYRLVELIMVYGSLIMAWYVVYRLLGLVFLGTSAIFGFSTYIFVTLHQQTGGRNIFISLASALLLTLLIFAVLVYFLLRTKGPYFAILTLGLNLAIPQITATVENSWFRVSARILNLTALERTIGFVAISIIFGVLISLLILIPRWRKLYLKLIAIKDSEDAAYSLGINAYRYRFVMLSFLLTIITLLGTFHTMQLFRIDPATIFSFDYTLLPLVGGFIASQLNKSYILLMIIAIGLPTFYYYVGIAQPGYLELILGLVILGVLAASKRWLRLGEITKKPSPQKSS